MREMEESSLPVRNAVSGVEALREACPARRRIFTSRKVRRPFKAKNRRNWYVTKGNRMVLFGH
jgi:hypothetical protein